ncbi:hypothetical protein [Acinetobacter sp.]|uniref:hypothetical protein n=1 Tax=Acinetobacter sp. TaxID=472 RepID=UPI00333FA206
MPPYFQDLIDIEWCGQVQSPTHSKRFKIKYYGEIFDDYQLICATDSAPELIYAVDTESKEEILLFDGVQHGCDPMFCDEFIPEQLMHRPVIHQFIDQDQQDVFEVIIKVYHNIDYDEEVESLSNTAGEIELISGKIISADQLKADGFEFIKINVMNSPGHEYSIFERELA